LNGYIDLSIGSVLIGPNDRIKKIAAATLLQDWQGYLNPLGLKELRQSILTNFYHNYRTINIENVLVTQSGTMGINLIYRLFNGKSILIPNPGFPLYRESAELYDIKVHSYRLGFENTWETTISDIEDGMKNGVKLIIINNPNNPNGYVFNEKQIKIISELCEFYDVMCLSDEVYRDFNFDQNEVPSPVKYIPHRTFLIYSFSKSFAMTGLRIGFVISPMKNMTKKLSSFQWKTMMSVSWHSQKIASYALNEERNYPESIRNKIKSNLEYLLPILNENEIKYYRPDGGIFICIDTEMIGMTADNFVKELIKFEKIVLSPCTSFGSTGKYVSRINLAVAENDLIIASRGIVNLIKNARVNI
jgi:aspartate/methionine/tyrosine aminotransferase